MIPTAVAAALRPPKSIVAVPESTPWVPITHIETRKPIAPRSQGEIESTGPAPSARESPAAIAGFGSGRSRSTVSPPRITVAGIDGERAGTIPGVPFVVHAQD